MKIRFLNEEHRSFFFNAKNKCRVWDSFHKALIYTLGLTKDTRRHINQLFDFDEDGIICDGINQPWQTSGSIRVCRMAFNLWNGYVDTVPRESTPYELYCGDLAFYFTYALMLAYPNCMTSPDYNVVDQQGNIMQGHCSKDSAEFMARLWPEEGAHVVKADLVIEEVE